MLLYLRRQCWDYFSQPPKELFSVTVSILMLLSCLSATGKAYYLTIWWLARVRLVLSEVNVWEQLQTSRWYVSKPSNTTKQSCLASFLVITKMGFNMILHPPTPISLYSLWVCVCLLQPFSLACLPRPTSQPFMHACFPFADQTKAIATSAMPASQSLFSQGNTFAASRPAKTFRWRSNIPLPSLGFHWVLSFFHRSCLLETWMLWRTGEGQALGAVLLNFV